MYLWRLIFCEKYDKSKNFLLKCKFEKFDSLTATTLYRCPGCIWLCNHCQRTKTPHSRLTPWEDLTLKHWDTHAGGGGGGGGTRSEKWWGCAAGRWKLDPKRSREKWNLGSKRSNSVRIGSFNTTKDRFGVGGWEKIPQKDRARSCQSEKRGSKPLHICITHHIGSTPPGDTWMHSHHCSYSSPGAKAPDHQYSQCWLNSCCTETVSYKNITLMVNNIRKYSGINTCMLLVSGLWLCKHSRQLHSPSLVAIGRSVGYETWPPILYWMALHFCNWLV